MRGRRKVSLCVFSIYANGELLDIFSCSYNLQGANLTAGSIALPTYILYAQVQYDGRTVDCESLRTTFLNGDTPSLCLRSIHRRRSSDKIKFLTAYLTAPDQLNRLLYAIFALPSLGAEQEARAHCAH